VACPLDEKGSSILELTVKKIKFRLDKIFEAKLVNTRIAGILYLLIATVSDIECLCAVANRVDTCNLTKKVATFRVKI
jgi:hypothetical protein